MLAGAETDEKLSHRVYANFFERDLCHFAADQLYISAMIGRIFRQILGQIYAQILSHIFAQIMGQIVKELEEFALMFVSESGETLGVDHTCSCHEVAWKKRVPGSETGAIAKLDRAH